MEVHLTPISIGVKWEGGEEEPRAVAPSVRLSVEPRKVGISVLVPLTASPATVSSRPGISCALSGECSEGNPGPCNTYIFKFLTKVIYMNIFYKNYNVIFFLTSFFAKMSFS